MTKKRKKKLLLKKFDKIIKKWHREKLRIMFNGEPGPYEYYNPEKHGLTKSDEPLVWYPITK